MHLLPAERSGHRIIDGERMCQAIAAITPPEAERDGRVIRYQLAEGLVAALLAALTGAGEALTLREEP